MHHGGEDFLVSAKECRDLVADCLRWAEMASHPDARQAFLAMANTWTRTALELELPNEYVNGELSEVCPVVSTIDEETVAFPPGEQLALIDRIASLALPAPATTSAVAASSGEESAA